MKPTTVIPPNMHLIFQEELQEGHYPARVTTITMSDGEPDWYQVVSDDGRKTYGAFSDKGDAVSFQITLNRNTQFAYRLTHEARGMFECAEWICKLYGTGDEQGLEELREEVTKLRNIVRRIRRDS